MHFRFFQTVILIIFSLTFGYAQNSEIYVSPQMQKIYNGETRSWAGTPGAGYWQNSSDYTLKVQFDPETRLVSGKGEIDYYNNSPDTLTNLVFRLYQDIFKKGISRDWGWGETDLHDGTEIIKLIIGGYELDPDTAARRTYTNLNVKLPEVIAPNSNQDVQIEWSFTLPDTVSIRMGRYREGAYFIAYWYPQIAVYDDVDGWDMTEYTGNVEFYNDFNNFDVEITVPENYLVRATGEMLNGDEILNEEIYNRYQNSLKSDSVIRIITNEDNENGIITKEGTNTWKYKAEYVPDFSFACVKDYLWDGISVVVDDKTGRRVLNDVLYREGDSNFNEAAYLSKLTIEFMSKVLPGVPFPYSHMTSFCNGGRGGGMETPMMANDGAPNSRIATLSLLCHENAHTYFPFFMGINERKYGWMDEGWASFFPYQLLSEFDSTFSQHNSLYRRYRSVIGKENEVPLMIPSKYLKGSPLGASIYSRAFFSYSALEDYLGREKFRIALQEYIHRWNGKHPLPYDFFFTFNTAAGEDLAWLLKPWFYDFGFCDLGIENENGNLVVKLIGNQPASVELKLTYKDGAEHTVNYNIGVWKNGKKELFIETDSNKELISAELLNSRIADLDEDNNKVEFH